MIDIKRNIEQLEFAGELLDRHSPTAARLSLFLVDNLAELVMHDSVRITMAKLAMHDSVRIKMARKDNVAFLRLLGYSPRKWEEILTRFGPKVSFLVKDLHQLNPDQGHILKVGHRLRNEAYHRGVLREDVIVPIAHVYFETVCNLVPSLWQESWPPVDESEVGNLVKKYGLDSHLRTREMLTEVCSTIRKGREWDVSQFAKVISDSLVSRIEQTISTLEYLATIRGRSSEEFLKWLQFRVAADTNMSEFVGSHRQRQKFDRKWGRPFAAFRPKVTLKKLRTWRKQADAISSEKSPGVILAKFNEIDKPFLDGYKPAREGVESLANEARVDHMVENIW